MIIQRGDITLHNFHFTLMAASHTSLFHPQHLHLWPVFSQEEGIADQSQDVVYSKCLRNQRQNLFLATLVALHFTPVSRWVGRSFGLA